MSFYLLSNWDMKKIDRIRKNFFWKGDIECNGFSCLVKWKDVYKPEKYGGLGLLKDVCKPEKYGGLGVLNLQVMNIALLSNDYYGTFAKV